MSTMRNGRCCSGAARISCKPVAAPQYSCLSSCGVPFQRSFLTNTSGRNLSAGATATPRSSYDIQSKAGVACFAATATFWGFTDGGGRGIGGSNRAGGNNNNNNSGGGSDGFGAGASWRFPRFLGHALLGALALVTAAVAFPAQSQATPGSMSSSPASSILGGSSFKDSLLSSSAPTRGGGLEHHLERASLGFSRDSSACTSPTRPRSKVMHVSCKGSTMVVPLTSSGAAKEAGISIPGVSLWQRRKIVEAPIELSEREARMLASRQNRVRDSLLVQ